MQKVDLGEYQRHAEQVRDRADGMSSVPVQGCQLAAAASALAVAVARGQDGLVTGHSYSKLLYDGLGDLLYRAAVLAGAAGLDLGQVAVGSLATLDDLHGQRTTSSVAALPVFDAGYPEAERFPRRFMVEFQQHADLHGRHVATAILRSAQPTLPAGAAPAHRPQAGARLGDPLTDNAREPDGYRFHDAIHLGFLAVLGWSPTMRALLRCKRKSDPIVDECEDGARAVFAEEGLAAVLARLAESRARFRRYHMVTRDVVDVARAVTGGLEVRTLPGWLWRDAIWQGFHAMDELTAHGCGLLVADLDAHELTYHPVAALPGPPQTQVAA